MASTADQLLAYLPAIYQEDPFLGQFLAAFQKVLLGGDPATPLPPLEDEDVKFPDKGLEESIANLASFFDPLQTPPEFLPWLAGWTAFSLRTSLDEATQRAFIAEIIPRYRYRGTKQNLQRLLEIFVKGTPTVREDQAAELQIGEHSTIGVDMYIGGGPPHSFQVTIALPQAAPAVIQRQTEIAHALIELEKPAHTVYRLTLEFPTMQIGVHSTVGVDTILGTTT